MMGVDMTGADLFDQFIIRGGYRTVLDVGANEGAFARKVRSLLPECEIHAFEPLPVEYEKLEKTLAGLSGVARSYKIALGSEDGNRTMNKNRFSPSSSVLEMESTHVSAFPHTGETEAITINMRKLDSWADGVALRGPTLLKLDVQGYEGQVLAGASNTLQRVSAVFTEVSFRRLYQDSVLFDDIYQCLVNQGFKFGGLCNNLLHPGTRELLQSDAVFSRDEQV